MQTASPLLADSARPDPSGGAFRLTPAHLMTLVLMIALALVAYDRGVPVYRARTIVALPAGAPVGADRIAGRVNDESFMLGLAEAARRAGAPPRAVDAASMADLHARIAATALASGAGVQLTGDGATPAQARATVALAAAATRYLIATETGESLFAPPVMEPYVERLAFGPPGQAGALLLLAALVAWLGRPMTRYLLRSARQTFSPPAEPGDPAPVVSAEDNVRLPPDRVGPALMEAIGAAHLVLVAGPPPRAGAPGSPALPPARTLAGVLAESGAMTLFVDLAPPSGPAAAAPGLADAMAGRIPVDALIHRPTDPGTPHMLTGNVRPLLTGDHPARLETLLRALGCTYDRIIVHVGDLAGIPALDRLVQAADHVVLIEPDPVASPRTRAVSERFGASAEAHRLTIALSTPAARRPASPFGVRASGAMARGFARRMDTRRTG